MDSFASTADVTGQLVPEPLRTLFNNPNDVTVQELPCALPGLDSLAVYLGAGARTVPHRHKGGQHLVFVTGTGVVSDDDGGARRPSRRRRQQPAGRLALYSATPGHAATHVTFEAPGDFDLDVESRDWQTTYSSDLND